MATYNQMQVQQKPKFSVAITTKGYQSLISNTLRDPARARRFTASITSAVAVNPALQECDAGTILAGALLGESLNLSPSPQLGQYYLVPFKQKAKYDRNNRLIRQESVTAQFVLGYKGYIQLALRSGQYADLDVTEIKQGEYLGKDSMTGKPKFQFIEDDDQRDALPTVGYMAYFEYMNGFRKVLYWSKEKMMNHADTYSKAFSRQKYEELLAGKNSRRAKCGSIRPFGINKSFRRHGKENHASTAYFSLGCYEHRNDQGFGKAIMPWQR